MSMCACVSECNVSVCLCVKESERENGIESVYMWVSLKDRERQRERTRWECAWESLCVWVSERIYFIDLYNSFAPPLIDPVFWGFDATCSRSRFHQHMLADFSLKQDDKHSLARQTVNIFIKWQTKFGKNWAQLFGEIQQFQSWLNWTANFLLSAAHQQRFAWLKKFGKIDPKRRWMGW